MERMNVRQVIVCSLRPSEKQKCGFQTASSLVLFLFVKLRIIRLQKQI
ncbi:hypothetical protein HMPREF9120_02532 [Neisseria sp. oral taxon 020 str. F0370]|nr:hypothetical protein HMPREF9120_02532 [Neisseria sp. oral taxon 020 str. F0370]